MGEMIGDAADRKDIEAVKNGNLEAFAGLVERHTPLVERIVTRHVPGERVGEVAQEAFVKACFSLKGFDGRKPFSHWLSVLAVRACHDFWRGHYRVREHPLAELSDDGQAWLDRSTAVDAREAYERGVEQREAMDVLDWALDQVSPRDRMILSLTALEGYTVAETAEMLGMSAVNVKVRAHRSRKRLKVLLEERLREGTGERQ